MEEPSVHQQNMSQQSLSFDLQALRSRRPSFEQHPVIDDIPIVHQRRAQHPQPYAMLQQNQP